MITNVWIKFGIVIIVLRTWLRAFINGGCQKNKKIKIGVLENEMLYLAIYSLLKTAKLRSVITAVIANDINLHCQNKHLTASEQIKKNYSSFCLDICCRNVVTSRSCFN